MNKDILPILVFTIISLLLIAIRYWLESRRYGKIKNNLECEIDNIRGRARKTVIEFDKYLDKDYFDVNEDGDEEEGRALSLDRYEYILKYIAGDINNLFSYDITEQSKVTWQCNCCNCQEKRMKKDTHFFRTMAVCKTCGNKRCPSATDHELKCTGSNEPRQKGSVY